MAKSHIDKLMGAVEESYVGMEPHRENRREVFTAMVGTHYGDKEKCDRRPVNLIGLEFAIFPRLLAAKDPAVRVSSRAPELGPSARAFGLSINKALKELQFAKFMRRLIMDAYAAVGMAKIGLAPSSHAMVERYALDAGEFVLDRVDFDDLVYDLRARSFEQTRFCGDLVRIDWEWAKGSGLFTGLKGLEPDAQGRFRDQGYGDTASGDRVDELEEGSRFQGWDEYRPQLLAWDIWQPLDGIIQTIPIQAMDRSVRDREWDGPAGGPYRMLGFQDVPGNVTPLSPAAEGMDLDELANQLFVKSARQALNQKNIATFEAGSEEVAERIENSEDGDWVRRERDTKIDQGSSGGVNPQGMAMFMQAKALFTWIRGNLDAIGGLGPQSETATQDQMMMASASRRVDDMQSRVGEFVQDIVETIAWYEWTDPLRERTLEYAIPGTSMTIPLNWTPETRRGDFLNFNFRIEPHSMVSRSPQEQLAGLIGILERVVYPLMPAFQEAGYAFDAATLLEKISDLGDFPELAEIVKPLAQSQRSANTKMIGSPTPAVTRRENVRINRSGTTTAGRDRAMMAELMGLGQNDEQRAAMTA